MTRVRRNERRIADVAARGLVLATLCACSDRTAPETMAVADSAGIELVTNLPGSIESAAAWTLSAEPVVAIGSGANPDVALFRVTDVAPLGGGDVAVGMNVPPHGLVFDADGRLVATLGREGEGPGEFSSVGSVVPLGSDSVAVWDPDRRRMSVFTTDGRFVREVDLSGIAPISTRAAPDMSSNSGLVHLLPSSAGSLVIFAEGAVDATPEPGIGRPALPSFRIGADGEQLASYGAFPGMEWVHGGPAGALPLPFGARTYAATTGDALVVGTAEATRFRVFGPDGALRRIVRWPDHDRAVGGPWLERWSTFVDSAAGGMREIVESLPRRERFPAYEGIISADGDEIWIGEYTGPVGIWPIRRAGVGPEAFWPVIRVPARRWLVFDGDGALAATVRTPEGFEPYAVRDGLVWGIHIDSLDVESVRAYELMRGAG